MNNPTRPRLRAVVADGLGVPRELPPTIGRDQVLVGWMPVPPAWAQRVRGLSIMGSATLSSAFAAGDLRYVPVRYSALPSLLRGRLRPDLAVVSARPSPEGLRFGAGVGYARIAAEVAERVVIEVDESQPVVDAPLVPTGRAEIRDATGPAPDAPPIALDDVDIALGARVAELIPVGATIQYGPGAVGEAILRALGTRVQVHSGMVTDAIAGLAARGLLNGVASATYLFGGTALRELARTGLVQLRGVEEIHALRRLGTLTRFHALNTALEVGLDGSVNVERAGGRQLGGVGGHSDFCAAAAACDAGLSVIAVHSTHRGRSTIVPIPERVTTQRSDIDVVVTEWGTADLRVADDEERAAALIRIAHPEFRDDLERSRA